MGNDKTYEQKLSALLSLKRAGADQPGNPLNETYRKVQEWLIKNHPNKEDSGG